MKINNIHSALRCVYICILLCMPSVVMAEAGQVVFVSGEASYASGQAVLRDDKLNEGDEIITGPDGRVQLLMQDGDRIAIRPDSHFVIERFETIEEQNNPADSQPDGKRIYKILEGGLRTLTDKTWKRNDSNYQVKTPVATIGIRGTDYELLLVKSTTSASGFGLYIAVYQGRVVVKNLSGTTVVYDNEYLYIDSENDPGTLLMAPPMLLGGNTDPANPDGEWIGAENSGIDSEAGLLESRRSPFEPESDEQTLAENTQQSPNPLIPPVPDNPSLIPQQRYTAFSSGQVADEQGFTGAGLAPSNATVTDAQGNLRRFTGLVPGSDGPQIGVYDRAGSTSVNNGQDPVSGLRWGRWAGGTATVTTAGGSKDIDLNNQSLHWIVSPEQAQATVLPITGVAEYRLVGNTNPTDNLGNVGFMDGTSTMTADFTNQSISTDMSLSINGQQWSAQDSNGSFGPGGTFAGEFDSVNVNGGNCSPCNGSGDYSGFFTGGNGSAPPPGAGMGYQMQNDGTTVNGAAAFGDPQPVAP